MATVVTNSGLALVTNRIKGGGTEPNQVAWGTGTGTAAAADTALGTESAEARVAGTSTQQTTTETDDTYQVVGTLVSASAQSISEAGLLDAATAGNLFVRGDFTPIALAVGESIQFTVKVQVS